MLSFRFHLSTKSAKRNHTSYIRMLSCIHWHTPPLPLPLSPSSLHLHPLHRILLHLSPRTGRPPGNQRDYLQHGAYPDSPVREASHRSAEEQPCIHLADRMGGRGQLWNVPSRDIPGSPDLLAGGLCRGGTLCPCCFHLWDPETRVCDGSETDY